VASRPTSSPRRATPLEGKSDQSLRERRRGAARVYEGRQATPGARVSVYTNLDGRDFRYFQFVFGRAQNSSDEEIVKELDDPEIDSPQVLYRQLAKDNYPVCPVCGKAPANVSHCAQAEQMRESGKRQPGPGTGRRTELPAAFSASELFADTLRGLLASVADLEFRHDSSQDGRVVGTDAIAGSSYLSRWCEINGKTVENLSEEQWDDLCARHGQDPAVKGFWVEGGGLKRAAGAARQPAEPETTLIGVYALAGGDMERLLEILYPGTPAQETREAIRKRVEGRKKPDKMDGLKAIAGQLATLVRGQSLSGAPPPGLTAVEHDAACHITMLRDEKYSNEEILAKLSNHRMADGLKLSMEDVHRLGNLRLKYPED
jgi:hypothetical protein